jgi:Magnesium chelatase, subunit ChlI
MAGSRSEANDGRTLLVADRATTGACGRALDLAAGVGDELAGKWLELRTAVVTTRPFLVPHHPSSEVGVIGGGQRPMSGEVSLVHHGILALDERPEYTRPVLEVLRQLLEDGVTKKRGPVLS